MKKVTHSKKAPDGDILGLCNKIEGWSVSKTDAIKEIGRVGNANSPYCTQADLEKVRIHVINDFSKGKYLRTDPDKTKKNNLSALPDC